MGGWAPGLAAAALVARGQLGWGRTHGVGHDAMWKWSPRGPMLGSWLALVQGVRVEVARDAIHDSRK